MERKHDLKKQGKRKPLRRPVSGLGLFQLQSFVSQVHVVCADIATHPFMAKLS